MLVLSVAKQQLITSTALIGHFGPRQLSLRNGNKDRARRFASRAMIVDSVLGGQGVAGNSGRVIFVLDAANKPGGRTQKQILEAANLPKDVVSKLIGSLASAGLLMSQRAPEDARIKRVLITESGRKLLSQVTAALQPPRPKELEPVLKIERLSLF